MDYHILKKYRYTNRNQFESKNSWYFAFFSAVAQHFTENVEGPNRTLARGIDHATTYSDRLSSCKRPKTMLVCAPI